MSTPTPDVSPELRTVLPGEWVRRYGLVPLRIEHGTLEVGAAAEVPTALLSELAFITGKRIVPVRLKRAEVEAVRHVLYPDLEHPDGSGSEERHRSTARPGDGPPADQWLGGTAVHVVDNVLHHAIAVGASDIHIEPYESRVRIRFRLDGALHVMGVLGPGQRDAVVSRVKILAALDIAEKRRPQDGRLRVTLRDRTVDLRVSTLPTGFGEKVVLRILDTSRLGLDLDQLGWRATDRAHFERAIRAPHGMVLVTGPTGSGKTTTLYAALSAVNSPGINILTIEDPVEYHLQGINQTQVRSEIGFTFAQALRAFLRQDPDVIMVGEIRDRETADIAVRAALTGHLVLSTLHTNDAPSAVARLADLGVPPFLVADAVRLVVAQRLVRRICSACKTPVDVEAGGMAGVDSGISGAARYEGTGCDACRKTGYQGRVALFEVMPVSEALGDLMARQAPAADLRRLAEAEGLQTLRQAGWEHVRAGRTTVAEVHRETGG